mgnify:CR=1 FL=1
MFDGLPFWLFVKSIVDVVAPDKEGALGVFAKV